MSVMASTQTNNSDANTVMKVLKTVETIQEHDEKPIIVKTTKISQKSKVIKKGPLTRTHKVRIEAHRGAGHLEPENTLKAFEKSLVLGIDGVELDVWLSQDKIPMVIHGHTQEGGLKTEVFEGIITETKAKDLQKVVLNHKEVIPKLADVLQLLKDKMSINIELKGKDLELAEKVVDIVEKHEMWSQIIFSSFHHEFHTHLRQYLKSKGLKRRIYFGFLAHKVEEFPDFNKIKAKPDDSYNLDYMLLEGEFKEQTLQSVKQAKEKGLRISFYFPMKETEGTKRYDTLLQVGADVIITNYPLELIEYLKQSTK